MIESIQTTSDDTEEGMRDVGIAAPGTDTTQSIFRTPAHCQASTHDVPTYGSSEAVINERVHSRKVGFQYVVQALVNSLPLLLVDIFRANRYDFRVPDGFLQARHPGRR